MSRIIVAGGTGFFGAALMQLLRAEGVRPVLAARLGPDRSYLTPVAPMVLAARRIAAGHFDPRGLVPAGQQVEAVELIEYLATLGVRLVRLEGPADP